MVDDIGKLQPTIFPSVPRLLTRIRDKILGTVDAGSIVTRTLFHSGFNAKLESLKSTGSSSHTFWDTLVFNKVGKLLGGKLRVIMSASAPVSPEVLNFLRVVFGCHVLEGITFVIILNKNKHTDKRNPTVLFP